MAAVQLVGLRRVILGKSVRRGTSNGERERKRAHGAQDQTQGGEGERRTDFQWHSAGQPAHWMRATDLYDKGGQAERNLDAFMEISAT